MPTEITDAIVLRQFEYSETSQVAVLFTRDHGLIRGLAKGSRRAPSAFDGGIEPLTSGVLGVALRNDRDLLTLTEWGVRRFYPGFRRSALAYAAATLCAEVAMRGFASQDPHPPFFTAIAGAFDRIDAVGMMSSDQPQPVATSLAAVARLLVAAFRETGLLPETPTGPIAETAVYAFDPASAIFGEHRRGQPVGSRWLVRGGTVHALASIASGAGTAEVSAAPNETLGRLVRFLAAWFRYAFGKELHSLALVARVIGRGQRVTGRLAREDW